MSIDTRSSDWVKVPCEPLITSALEDREKMYDEQLSEDRKKYVNDPQVVKIGKDIDRVKVCMKEINIMNRVGALFVGLATLGFHGFRSNPLTTSWRNTMRRAGPYHIASFGLLFVSHFTSRIYFKNRLSVLNASYPQMKFTYTGLNDPLLMERTFKPDLTRSKCWEKKT